jgi:hypothetical protein
MNGISLSDSIFGNDENCKEKNSSLSSLFGSSTTLPDKPNNLNFIEPTKNTEKRERKEEKKRKRKQKDATEEERKSDIATENGNDEIVEDHSSTNEDEEKTIFVGNLPGDMTRKKLS